jgi:hypothetical protein
LSFTELPSGSQVDPIQAHSSNHRFSEVVMKSKLIATLLLAATASLAAPAFASGYGPAPFYRPEAGAPSSQSGPSARTLAEEQNTAAATQSAVGGMADSSISRSGSRRAFQGQDDGPQGIYRGR